MNNRSQFGDEGTWQQPNNMMSQNQQGMGMDKGNSQSVYSGAPQHYSNNDMMGSYGNYNNSGMEGYYGNGNNMQNQNYNDYGNMGYGNMGSENMGYGTMGMGYGNMSSQGQSEMPSQGGWGDGSGNQNNKQGMMSNQGWGADMGDQSNIQSKLSKMSNDGWGTNLGGSWGTDSSGKQNIGNSSATTNKGWEKKKNGDGLLGSGPGMSMNNMNSSNMMNSGMMNNSMMNNGMMNSGMMNSGMMNNGMNTMGNQASGDDSSGPSGNKYQKLAYENALEKEAMKEYANQYASNYGVPPDQQGLLGFPAGYDGSQGMWQMDANTGQWYNYNDTGIYLNAINLTRWKHLRERFGNSDDKLFEHLTEVHEEMCRKCRGERERRAKAERQRILKQGGTLGGLSRDADFDTIKQEIAKIKARSEKIESLEKIEKSFETVKQHAINPAVEQAKKLLEDTMLTEEQKKLLQGTVSVDPLPLKEVEPVHIEKKEPSNPAAEQAKKLLEDSGLSEEAKAILKRLSDSRAGDRSPDDSNDSPPTPPPVGPPRFGEPARSTVSPPKSAGGAGISDTATSITIHTGEKKLV